MTWIQEKLIQVGGCIVALLLAFGGGYWFARRRVQPAPVPAGHILAEAPKPEERTGSVDHPSVTLKRSVADTRILSRARDQRPGASPTRAAEVVAETTTGETLNLTMVETRENDGTERITFQSDDGKIVGGTDWAFPIEPPRVVPQRRWDVLALARSDFSARPNFGAGIIYRKGPITGLVAGFKKEMIVGVGISF